LMVIDPRAGPGDFGVNVTFMTHVAEGFTVPPFAHVVPPAIAKLPLIETVLMARGVVPVFPRVTVMGGLVDPTFRDGKVRTNGLSEACGLIGVPASGTDCGLPAAESVTTSAADCKVV
jgi:hypothetical protein